MLSQFTTFYLHIFLLLAFWLAGAFWPNYPNLKSYLRKRQNTIGGLLIYHQTWFCILNHESLMSCIIIAEFYVHSLILPTFKNLINIYQFYHQISSFLNCIIHDFIIIHEMLSSALINIHHPTEIWNSNLWTPNLIMFGHLNYMTNFCARPSQQMAIDWGLTTEK